MEKSEQIDALSNDLDSLIDRYSQEFDLTYAEVIGTLQVKVISLLAMQARNDYEEQEEGDYDNLT